MNGGSAPPSCAEVSRACGEHPWGTASRARRWVLLEQPGAWGRDALAESDLPPAVATHLRALAARLPARVLLLRRTGGGARNAGRRVLYAGVSTPTGGWLERLDLDHVDEVLDLDLAGVADATTVGGDRVDAPLYLVCTNGKHDPCCAAFGLPVARALDEVAPGRVWECSHVGGDRFAGNLVCLPDGLLYGHLDPDSARTTVAAHEAGRIALPRWRGRSALPFPAQAAEALARQRLGLDRLDELAVTAVQRVGGTHEVHLRGRDGRAMTAVVSVDREVAPRKLTCADAPAVAPTYRLDELRTEDAPGRT
jgi:hypothetical protein